MPNDFPILLGFIFMVPISLCFLFIMWFIFCGLIINYLLMLIFPKKYKEYKMLCYCRECGEISVIQN